jgi:hypothetical protein
MACALVLVFLIPYRPRWVLMLAVAAVLAGPVVLINQLSV